MKGVAMLAVATAVIGIWLTPLAMAASLEDLIEQVRPGVVGVGTAYPPRQPNVSVDRVTYLATGFVVGDGHQIVTNAHVIALKLDVDNHQTLAIFTGQGAAAMVHVARELRRDEEHDLALLEISGAPLPALQLGNSASVREGQDIAFTGFPLGMALGLHPVTHRGIVSAITPTALPVVQANELTTLNISRVRSDFEAFQLDATAYPGNSGSPVFELKNGRVVGVINSVVVKETREAMLSHPSGITYAIPVKYLEPLLKAATNTHQ